MTVMEDHTEVCKKLRTKVAAAQTGAHHLHLRKDTSNLFRRRAAHHYGELDARGLDRVLHIDPNARTATVEGMLTYEAFVAATLPYGLLPAVVPQLKTITVGGAVSGLGIESASHRYGLVHETVRAMEVLTGAGELLACSRTSNPEFFFGFPNSYGSLGYALSLTVNLIPAKRFVNLKHRHFADPQAFFRALADARADFLDASIFAPDQMFLTEARLCEHAPYTSDYTGKNIYYRSIQQREEDWLTMKDYIWRWDTDWFWCSRQFHLENRLLRWFAQPWLHSRYYQQWMRLAQRLMPDRGTTESIIQDVQIPIEHAAQFLEFLFAEIPIKPIWVCPFRTGPDAFPLTALRPSSRYVNFGFWDVVAAQGAPGTLNRKVERKAFELGGTKALYSSAYYEEAEFWRIYDRNAYASLKSIADPHDLLPGLYDKAVRRA